MAEDLLEAEAVEEESAPSDDASSNARRLPEKRSSTAVSAWKGEVRTAALAAAGGLVAGAATVAAVKATTGSPSRGSRKGLMRSRRKDKSVLASRSFLVDVHLLDR
ncbi:hypothetical protein BH10ACT11_BH10ACT11_15730 [soil metagenome]